LKARNVKVVAEPFNVEAIARRIAFFSDPWGNLFELEEILT
jgi:glyoxylase I family protein